MERKTYEVSGDRPVLGYEPGDTFDAEIPDAQETRLLNRGALRVVGEESSSGDEPAVGSTFSTDLGGDDDDNPNPDDESEEGDELQ